MADYELSEEAKAAGLSLGRNRRISQADRDRAVEIMGREAADKEAATRNSPDFVDPFSGLKAPNNDVATAYPVHLPNLKKMKQEPKPKNVESEPERKKSFLERYPMKGPSDAPMIANDMSMRGAKKGGAVKKMAKGGKVGNRGDGCCAKGKTKGRFV